MYLVDVVLYVYVFISMRNYVLGCAYMTHQYFPCEIMKDLTKLSLKVPPHVDFFFASLISDLFCEKSNLHSNHCNTLTRFLQLFYVDKLLHYLNVILGEIS